MAQAIAFGACRKHSGATVTTAAAPATSAANRRTAPAGRDAAGPRERVPGIGGRRLGLDVLDVLDGQRGSH